MLTACLSVTRSAPAEPPAAANQLFQRLIGRGVQLSDNLTVPLPEPAVPDGLDPAAQQKVLRKIVGATRWRVFFRDSPVAPFVLKQTYLTDKHDQRVGHAIDLWFIAYGELADFQDERLGEDFFAKKREATEDEASDVRELNDRELSQAGLAGIDKDRERYVLAELPLMNRVHIRAVGHAEHSRSDDSLLLAWELVPGFPDQPELASRWYPLETTELGERRRGEPRPYQGYGGYLKITALAEPAGALLFETHVVFHEPEQWFHGSNFLRSKTPLVVRENVDKLRRRLARVQRERP